MAVAGVDLPEIVASLVSSHGFIASTIGLARALAGALVVNVVLDIVERADARQHLGGDRRGRRRLDLEEATAHMRQQKASVTSPPLAKAS